MHVFTILYKSFDTLLAFVETDLLKDSVNTV